MAALVSPVSALPMPNRSAPARAYCRTWSGAAIPPIPIMTGPAPTALRTCSTTRSPTGRTPSPERPPQRLDRIGSSPCSAMAGPTVLIKVKPAAPAATAALDVWPGAGSIGGRLTKTGSPVSRAPASVILQPRSTSWPTRFRIPGRAGRTCSVQIRRPRGPGRARLVGRSQRRGHDGNQEELVVRTRMPSSSRRKASAPGLARPTALI